MSRFAVAALFVGALLVLLGPADVVASGPGQDGAFPVVIQAANGKVTIEQRPTRIVSLSPSATETLYAIGAGKQVKAVDHYSDYPSGTPRTSISPFSPNVEAILGLRPDLVVVSSDTNEVVLALTTFHVPVLLEPPAKTLAEAYDQMRDLGEATGHQRETAGLIGRMRARIAALVASVPRPARPVSVYHEISPDFYSATSQTFVGRIYQPFGLANIADPAAAGGGEYPKLSPEYIVGAAPDLIVLADTVCCGQTPATVAARPGWQTIPAVRKRAIVRLDDSIAARWGPRIVNFVRAIASALRTLGV